MAAPVKISRQVGRPSLVGKAVENWLFDVASWIQDWQIKSGHYTQSSTSSVNQYEVRINKNPDNGELLVSAHLGFAVMGRKSGGWPPPDAIKDWIERKPLKIEGDISIDQLAFLIGRKIAEQGTDEPKLRAQNIKIVVDNYGKKHLSILADEMAKQTADDLVKSINNRIKRN